MSTKQNAAINYIQCKKQQIKLININLKKNLRFFMYDLHSSHRQVSGCHFPVNFIKAFNDVSCLNSFEIIFKIFGPRNAILHAIIS